MLDLVDGNCKRRDGKLKRNNYTYAETLFIIIIINIGWGDEIFSRLHSVKISRKGVNIMITNNDKQKLYSLAKFAKSTKYSL